MNRLLPGSVWYLGTGLNSKQVRVVFAGPVVTFRNAYGRLRRHGLTKSEIATRLGSVAETPSLQLNTARVTALNALKVRKLLVEVRAEVATEQAIGEICTSCGDSHDKPRRLEWVRAHREADFEEMLDAQSCWYGDGETGKRRLHRDRAEVRGEAS